jgi:CDP-diacylglycerol--inositol 3-phosphatidyltransferase
MGGSESHKSIKKDGNIVLRLYYTSRAVLFWVCAFNELFYILLYCQYYGTFTKANVAGQHLNLTLILLAVSTPIWALKQIINVIQMVDAAKHLASLDVSPSSRKKI